MEIGIVEAAKIVGKNPQSIQRRAKAENWIGTPVPGQKWRRYSIDLFPLDWQAAIYKAHAVVPPEPAPELAPEPVDHIVDAPKKVDDPAPVVAHGQQKQMPKPATVPAALPPTMDHLVLFRMSELKAMLSERIGQPIEGVDIVGEANSLALLCRLSQVDLSPELLTEIEFRLTPAATDPG